jgi:hypothetical protein
MTRPYTWMAWAGLAEILVSVALTDHVATSVLRTGGLIVVIVTVSATLALTHRIAWTMPKHLFVARELAILFPYFLTGLAVLPPWIGGNLLDLIGELLGNSYFGSSPGIRGVAQAWAYVLWPYCFVSLLRIFQWAYRVLSL